MLMILFWLWTHLAFAHHGAPVGRVGSGVDGPAAWDGSRGPNSGFQLAVAFDSTLFSRTREGWKRFAGADLAAVTVHRAAPGLRLGVGQRAFVGLTMPFGLVIQRGSQAEESASRGLGDLAMRFGGHLQGGDEEQTSRSLVMTGGIQAPTGLYSTETALSLVRLIPDSNGQIQVSPYDVRASLGSGSWAADVAVDGALHRGPWTVSMSVSGHVPLTVTSDDIRWGADVRLVAGGYARLLGERVVLGSFIDATGHMADQVSVDVLGDGVVEPVRAGGRGSLGGTVFASATLVEGVTCGIQMRAPYLQGVQGIQLTESVNGGLSCRWNLRRPERNDDSTNAFAPEPQR